MTPCGLFKDKESDILQKIIKQIVEFHNNKNMRKIREEKKKCKIVMQ